MYQNRHRVRCFLLLPLCCIILCACNADTHTPLHEGETYLDGSWYFSEGNLHVGYNFFPDGGGQQFIGGTTIPMRYGILGQTLYLLMDEQLSSLSFAQTEEGLLIGGLLFQPVDTNQLPDDFASFEAALSQAQESRALEDESNWRSNPVFWCFCAVMLALAVMLVLLLIRLVRALLQRKR